MQVFTEISAYSEISAYLNANKFHISIKRLCIFFKAKIMLRVMTVSVKKVIHNIWRLIPKKKNKIQEKITLSEQNDDVNIRTKK